MHASSFERMAGFAKNVQQQFAGQAIRILDVGSMNVNGEYRQLFRWANVDYVGLDIAAGPNVDVVPKDPYDWRELEDDSFDVVISGSAIEHIEFPWLTVQQIARKLKPGGIACLIAPSRGPEHRYPIDCYRYYPDGLAALAKWVGLDVVEHDYIREGQQSPDGGEMWGDASCVLSKPVGAAVRGPEARLVSTAGASGEANPPVTRFNPCDYPLCWTFPSMLSRCPPSAWIEHIPFAFALVQMIRPRCVVELGVQAGDSFLAFCQAVKTLGLAAKCYGVDHWQGDGHAGASGSEVLDGLRRHHEPRYGAFSRLVQSSFDEAVRCFPDDGIDLLHIDGRHTYETLHRDFENWKPKLSSRAVVLFHDLNVREHDYGAWRLWQELSAVYPCFEFSHGHGLGVLVYGKEAPPAALQLAELRGPDADAVRYFYFTLGHKLLLNVDLNESRDAGMENQKELAASRDKLTACRDELAACRKELDWQQARLALITGSRVWRLRERLYSIPGVRQVAGWMNQ